MPVYTIRRENGVELEIDTTYSVHVRPPSRHGAVVDVYTFGQPDSLTLPEAVQLAAQDFKARPGNISCQSCYFHGRRVDIGNCGDLCCALRREGLLQGVEISSYVKEPPPPRKVEPVPYWLPIRFVGWSAVLIWTGGSLRSLFNFLLGLCALALVLLLAHDFQSREPSDRRKEL